MDEEVKKLLDKTAKTYRDIGETPQLTESEIGRAVCALLCQNNTISVADLIQYFNDKIQGTKSAKGECKKEHDLKRTCLESAVKLIRSLRDDRPSEPPEKE